MSSNRTIVPNANEGKQNQSQNVKYEVAQEQGVPLNKGYNGDITAKQAGKIGGNIGGNMVKEMVRQAEQNLKNQSQ